MASNLRYWAELYREHKWNSVCVDIESDGRAGPITVVGVYKPQWVGEVQCQQFVAGYNLTEENLRNALAGVKAIVTYYGLKFDIPRIRQWYPSAIPHGVPIIDLGLFSWNLYKENHSLKTWQNTFNQVDGRKTQRGYATKLWRQWRLRGDKGALYRLLEYNKDDLVDLHSLGDKFSAEILGNDTPVFGS